MTQETEKAHILVAAGSKHGSTDEIAHHVASTLRADGHHVTEAKPAAVVNAGDFDAIVLGSAVYAGHWTGDAKDLASRIGDLTTMPDVWLFSSGPVGDPPKPEEEPVDVADVIRLTAARGHRVFSGRIDKAKLTFGEKAIVMALRAPEGDFRQWDEIGSWASSIAAAVRGKVTST